MHGLLKYNINTGVQARACGADVSQRCHNSLHWKRGYGVWVTSRTGRARRILGIWRKLSRVETRQQTRRLTFACLWRPLWRVPHVLGARADEKTRIERLRLSHHVKEPLNSKVIKSFVPELRSRKRFSYFEIPMFYVLSLWTFDVRFTHSHIMAMVHWEQWQ